MTDVTVKELAEKAPYDPSEENMKKGTVFKEEEKESIASGWSQVGALMEKNALTKLRTPAATLAELLSPVILMVVLWGGYNMSDVHNVPAKMFHAINVEFPLFWKNGTEESGADQFAGDWDLSDTHRRQLQGPSDPQEESNGETPTLGKWIRMLGEQGGMVAGAPEEEFSLVNDMLMMSHFRDLLSLDDDEDFKRQPLFDDEVIDLDEAEDESDSGDWWEEVLADIKKETIDKIDWNEVEDEVKENLGDIWDQSKAYVLYQDDNNAYTRLEQLRVQVSVVVLLSLSSWPGPV